MDQERKVSTAIRVLMAIAQMNQTQLAAALGVSRGALNNKFYRDSFGAEELVRIASACGAKLYFRAENGMEIPVESERAVKDAAEKAEDL